jgi:aldehyde dehydrogenase family protein
MRVASRIEAGMVAVNCGRVSCVAAPFGGVKHSGFGHTGGPEGIDEYLVTRYVTIPEAGVAASGAPRAAVGTSLSASTRPFTRSRMSAGMPQRVATVPAPARGRVPRALPASRPATRAPGSSGRTARHLTRRGDGNGWSAPR